MRSGTRSTPGCAPSAEAPESGIIGVQAIAPREAPMTRVALLLAAGLLVWTGPTPAAADATGEANKKVVVEFYGTALNRKDFEAASKFFGPRYVQHNPTAPDGIESWSEIRRVWAEGDYVILHVHAVRTPGARGSAIVDIFKLENGKIVEHWDVIQEIPEKAANNNGMF
jgi:predicted SnoaL-like aldol condensation-catalyzing enzyme